MNPNPLPPKVRSRREFAQNSWRHRVRWTALEASLVRSRRRLLIANALMDSRNFVTQLLADRSGSPTLTRRQSLHPLARPGELILKAADSMPRCEKVSRRLR